jgi:hypothetical protein
MNYLALVYQDEEQWAGLAAGERPIIQEACLAYTQEMAERGYILAAEDFQDNQPTLTVRQEAGQIELAEDISADTKNRLSQLFVIKARDLNEAIQIVSNMPHIRRGPIKVRALQNLEWLKDRGQRTE